MKNSIRLHADSRQIEINITNPVWCKCWLQDGQSKIYLGAESLEYIQSHLLNGFKNSLDNYTGDLNGKEVRWILSLAEAHHSLYVANSDRDKLLFWQDRYGKTISKIELPTKTVKRWLAQLNALGDNLKESA